MEQEREGGRDTRRRVGWASGIKFLSEPLCHVKMDGPLDGAKGRTICTQSGDCIQSGLCIHSDICSLNVLFLFSVRVFKFSQVCG